MTLTLDPAPGPPVEPVTPADLIARVRAARARREQADHDILTEALAWAVAHEVEGPQSAEQVGAAGLAGMDFPAAAVADGSECLDDVERSAARSEWRGLPELTWESTAPFAAALGMSTRGGRTVLRHALTMAHRLPRTQVRWELGRITTRVARQVADAVAGQPDDVCAWVDVQVARRIDTGRVVGPVVAERLVDQAMAELHAEELELERQEQLLARFARCTDGPGILGLADFVIRGDWPDVKAFDDTIAALAEALRRGDGPAASESLDVRRSIAVGLLADPARALALLDSTSPASAGAPASSARKQRMLVAFHLAADAVAGHRAVDPDWDDRGWLDSVLREWAGRSDVDLTVRPFVHCGGCAECDEYCDDHPRQTYRPTDLDKERVAMLNPRCVFPFCAMSAGRCDCDHIVAHDPDSGIGPTCPRCNLAPLCRHHHRLKTLAGWSYRQVEPGVFTWSEPHGQHFLTTRQGTRDTTPAPSRDPAIQTSG